jgi:molybdopterin synthase catalytic subunit
MERGLRDGATVDDLWADLCDEHPQLTALGPSVSFAVNREYVDRGHILNENDEVALIPPVSGGSGGDCPTTQACGSVVPAERPYC